MKTKNKLPFKCSETFKEYLIGRFERENEKMKEAQNKSKPGRR